MASVKLAKVKRYDGGDAYHVMVDGVKVAEVYRDRDGSPIMARDRSLNYAVGFRAAMVWRVADRIKRPNGEWCYVSGLTWRTRKDAVEWVLKITGHAA